MTLIEKQNRLGGNLHPAGAAFFKDDIRKLCQVLIRRVECAGVKVVLNKTATPADIEDMAPDAVMIAIGSNELRPPIKGINGENVIMAIDAELHPEKLENVLRYGWRSGRGRSSCLFCKRRSSGKHY